MIRKTSRVGRVQQNLSGCLKQSLKKDAFKLLQLELVHKLSLKHGNLFIGKY